MKNNNKIAVLLNKEKDYNNERIDNAYNKKMVLNTNCFKDREKRTFTYAIAFYFIEGITFCILAHAGLLAPILTGGLMSQIIITSSIAGGVVVNSVINHIYNKKIKETTNINNNKELDEELIRNEIRIEKLENRNMAIGIRLFNKEDEEPTIKKTNENYEELKMKISSRLHDLDTATTRYFLIREFGDLYKRHFLFEKLVIDSLYTAFLTFLAFNAPLIAANIETSLFNSIIAQFIIGAEYGFLYNFIKIVKDRNLFNKLNDELGKDKLDIKEIKSKKCTNLNVKWEIFDIDKDIAKLIEQTKIVEEYLEQNKSTKDNEIKESYNQELQDIKIVNSIMDEPYIHRLTPQRKTNQ
ncbi:MAG: hypothetical protein J5892_03640 [Bacilli bacterium]|nr:hypothetical protein [Bacilli bacterium]